MIFRFIVIILILSCSTTTVAQIPVIDKLFNSVCRIVISNDKHLIFGTAFCVKEDKDNYYFITAGHNIEGEDQTKCTLIFVDQGEMVILRNQGKVLSYINGNLCKNKPSLNDIGLVSVEKSIIIKKCSKPLSLLALEKKENFEQGQDTYTLGYSENWPTLLKTKIIPTFHTLPNEMICFYPVPETGRSGSPLTNKTGNKVVGMITVQALDYNLKEYNTGGAIPSYKIQKFLNNYFEKEIK